MTKGLAATDAWVPVAHWLKGPFAMLPVEVSVTILGQTFTIKLRRLGPMGQMVAPLTISGERVEMATLMRVGAAALCPDIVRMHEDESVNQGAPRVILSDTAN